jgi:hypothetical protein
MQTKAHRWRLGGALAAGLLGTGAAGAQGLVGAEGQALAPGARVTERIAPAPPGEAEPTGGPNDPGWASVFGFEFLGRTQPFEFTTSETTGALWCTGGSERFAEARLDVPDNASLEFLRMWGFKDAPGRELTVFLFESCLPNLGAGPAATTNLAEVNSGTLSDTFTVATTLFDQPVTNTRECTYWVRVRFDDGCTAGGQATLRKVRVQYRPE